ncbi:unnamed protein product [Schistosoma curassoni]|uniref:Uncharacterized protein n=1 Tax=Schistosoma curassoni TaxID=6186 RepID=A0A183L6G1_9TREM|nr:unnamed protein product [Schistosoma curassoni]
MAVGCLIISKLRSFSLQDDILDFESKKKKKSKPLVHDFKDEPGNLGNQDILDFGSKKKKKDKLLSLDDVGSKEDSRQEPEFHKKDPTENGVKQLTEKLTDELTFSDKKKKKKFRPIEVDENGVCEPSSMSELIVRDSSGYDYETVSVYCCLLTNLSVSLVSYENDVNSFMSFHEVKPLNYLNNSANISFSASSPTL